MRRIRMAMSRGAVLLGRRGVLFGLVMAAMIVMVGSFAMVVGGCFVMRGGGVMVIAGRVLVGSHVRFLIYGVPVASGDVAQTPCVQPCCMNFLP
ncbi:hypothetical protein NDN01_17930 [Sphingomonas sp. QA11]|uniref:hypothetical protein n=1 Tax=Sphingomonas sp. QA11 TaxID=2950605 RepID=UPI00234A138C|nr:hypothetical protein [Sphingomonas sp. QA11]WCM25892.1 hypothetical protein NDN01_17930 [Sphingomonas sp. QA11]